MSQARQTTLWLICWVVVSGAGCDACSRGLGLEGPVPEGPPISDVDRLAGDEQRRADQFAADKYRDRIVPGLGCDRCPSYCRLVDLSAIEPSAFQEQFRKVVWGTHSDDSFTYKLAIIEHNRLTCLLKLHDSLSEALVPLLHEREHPRIRFEAAWIGIAYGLQAGDPKGTLYELADGSGVVARYARAAIVVLDRDGWPE